MSTYNIKIVKCRKMHRCQKCKATINIGDKAYRVNTLDTKVVYRCADCKLTNAEIRDIVEDRYNERYEDLNKRIGTEDF